jgi:hypothetical protein
LYLWDGRQAASNSFQEVLQRWKTNNGLPPAQVFMIRTSGACSWGSSPASAKKARIIEQGIQILINLTHRDLRM